jgi:hypothetical protein
VYNECIGKVEKHISSHKEKEILGISMETLQQDEYRKLIAKTLIVSVLAWTAGFAFFLQDSRAANLSYVKDTLSTSQPSAYANHTIIFNASSGISNGQTITITFPTSSFDMSQITFTDVDIASTSDFSVAANCSGAEPVSLTTSTNQLTFTFCSGDGGFIGANGTTTLEIGTNATFGVAGTHQIMNPATSTTYRISIGGTQLDSGVTMVSIIPRVQLTASIDSTFTFTINAVTSSTVINGVTTTLTSLATSSAFGTLLPNVPQIMGQRLDVTTNARNGFLVTVVQDQNMTSYTGADIDLFRNGNATSVPSAWTAPSSTLDVENTYGHYGITTDDKDLTTDTADPNDNFATATFVGNITTPRNIFAHNGPSDGTTANKGRASVAVKIEIGSLQEAANDYSNYLTFVATPTF